MMTREMSDRSSAWRAGRSPFRTLSKLTPQWPTINGKARRRCDEMRQCCLALCTVCKVAEFAGAGRQYGAGDLATDMELCEGKREVAPWIYVSGLFLPLQLFIQELINLSVTFCVIMLVQMLIFWLKRRRNQKPNRYGRPFFLLSRLMLSFLDHILAVCVRGGRRW